MIFYLYFLKKKSVLSSQILKGWHYFTLTIGNFLSNSLWLPELFLMWYVMISSLLSQLFTVGHFIWNAFVILPLKQNLWFKEYVYIFNIFEERQIALPEMYGLVSYPVSSNPGQCSLLTLKKYILSLKILINLNLVSYEF